MNIKDAVAERLAAEISELTGESKTRAVRTALAERKERLAFRVVRRDREADLLRLLESEIWPAIPRRALGKRLSRREKEAILGYGSEGV